MTLIELRDGTFMLAPKTSKVMESADKVAKMLKDANVTLEDLLETLDIMSKNKLWNLYT
jgi:hypothetical protein